MALHKPALESIRSLIRSATTSMTSVPKPLKFLRSHYSTMSQLHAAWPSTHSNTHFLADILSVLGMTYAADANRDCLKYKLLGSQEPLGSWGHEYVRYPLSIHPPIHPSTHHHHVSLGIWHWK